MPRFRPVAAGVVAALVGTAAPAPSAQVAPAPSSPVVAPSVAMPDSLSLDDARTLALARSPDLAAFAFETRAREALLVQAGRRPNPTLSAEAENLFAPSDADGTDQAQTTVQVSQLVELGRRRAARVRLAEAERDLLPFDVAVARLDVAARVAARFALLVAAQDRARLALETATLAEQGLGTTAQQVSLGDRSPIEQTRASVALATVRAEAARAGRAREAAARQLAALWGAAETPPAAVVGTLGPPPALPTFAALVARLDATPDLGRFTAEAARRDALVAAERAARTPGLTVSAGVRQFHRGGNAVVVGLSVPVPMFGRNGGGIRAAEERREATDAEREAVRSALIGRLAEAYGRLAAAHDEARILNEAAVPGALDAFEAVREGYRLGRFDYLEVLDAQRTYVDARGRLLDARASYVAAAAEVERLTGVPLLDDTPATDEIPRLPGADPSTRPTDTPSPSDR